MFFPIGPLVDAGAIALAGILGSLVGTRLDERVSKALTTLMGFVALAIGIVLVIRVQTLGAVVLALVIGTLIGTLLKLDDHANSLFKKINLKLFKSEEDEEKLDNFNTILVLHCFSGTGIFGAINEGLTGDPTILICKAIMGFVTVFVFATQIGKICSLISVPQLFIQLCLFFLAVLARPLIDDPILKGDFSAVGGVIELILALKILKLVKFKTIDALPALILIFPITILWNYIF